MRDDFSEVTKRTLANRTAHRCSNPDCRAITSGPQTDPNKALNVGVAAHISAAAPGGPRYDAAVPPEDRAGVANAIWLCQTCAKLIDNDPQRYPSELLRSWREGAESHALEAIGKTFRPGDRGDVHDLWVSEKYPASTGLAARLNAEGYTLRWVRANRVAELIDSGEWEEVIVERNGERVRLKIRDSAVGFLHLLRKPPDAKHAKTANAVFRQILSALPAEHLDALGLLMNGAAPLPTYDPSTQSLEKMGAIHRLAELDRHHGVYSLRKDKELLITQFLIERRERAVRECLEAYGDEARFVLELFTEPNPAPGLPQHRWIPAQAYNSLQPLFRAGVLVQTSTPRTSPSHVDWSIPAGAVRLVEDWLGKPLQRCTIDIDFSQVGSAADRGGGIRGGY